MTKEQSLKEIEKLVNRFEFHYDSYKSIDYNETQTRRDFIDPFFKALGWDIDNEQNFAESYRDVIHEAKTKIREGKTERTKAPDYAFRIGGRKIFFLEAKRPNVSIKDAEQPAYQIRRYGWSAKLPISIITDFEEFSIYDCTKKPNPSDKASVSRLKYITFRDYIKEFDFLWDTFSKESVLKGCFDKFVKTDTSKKGTETVDNEFLQSLDKWRTQLALNISLNNKQIDEYELNFVVQQTIDRLIFLRIAEDRNIEQYGQLRECLTKGDYYKNLFVLFKNADEKYNSGLFDFKKDKISEKIKIDNKIINSIITELYFPECPYEFSVLSVEILGSAYEQFLGKVIRITHAHNAKIEEKPEVRKAGGVYYTPQYIVDYIVQNTIGKLIDGLTPKEIEKIKIIDPACGSGSFLIGAYQYLLDWHKNYYSENEKVNSPKNKFLAKELTPEGNLSSFEKKKILINNIFGVDLDVNAVEVTKLSLLLKCMEGETEASINQQLDLIHERVLPTLENNIKSGNSLIDTDYYDDHLDFGDEKKVKPFNWQKSFPEIFKFGGFDIVIGNPPYVDYRLIDQFSINYLNQKYLSTQTKEKWSLYLPFIELGTKILKSEGLFGMIIPNTFLSADFGKPTRKILLENTSIVQLVDVSTLKVFGNVGTYPVLLFFKNNFDKSNFIFINNPSTKNELSKPKFEKIKQSEILAKNQNLIISTSYSKNNFNLINKIEKRGTPLKNLVSKFSWGTSISGFKSYKISVKDYHKLSSKEKKNYEKVIQTADIKPFAVNWKKEYINTSIYSESVKNCFNQNKIVIARLTKRIQATIDSEKYFMGKSSFIINPKIDPKYLIGLLNSNLLNYFFLIKFTNTHLAGGYLRFDIPYLEKLPIKLINENNQIQKKHFDEILKNVELLLNIKKELLETKLQIKISQLQSRIDHYENRINEIVYQLYELTDEEIKIIEENV